MVATLEHLKSGPYWLVYFQQQRLWLCRQISERARPRRERPDAIPDGTSRLIPNDVPVLLADFCHMRRERSVLFVSVKFSGNQAVYRFH